MYTMCYLLKDYPGPFEDSLCNGQRKIKETRFKKKKDDLKLCFHVIQKTPSYEG